MAEPAATRLSRLLSLVPYLLEHEGVGIEETAHRFGIDRKQLIADLSTLYVSGTPGHYPDDLIEVAWDDDTIHISNVQGITQRLRLSAREAAALIVALRALASTPGLTPSAIVQSAVAKLQVAAGEAVVESEVVDVSLSDEVSQGTIEALRGAIRAGKRVWIRYVSATDRVSEREIDPLQILSAQGHWYTRAWCHEVGAERHFRLDRVTSIVARDVSITANPAIGAPDITAFSLDTQVPTVSFEVAPTATWVIETLPIRSSVELDDEWRRVELAVVDPVWFERVALELSDRIRNITPPQAGERIARLAGRALALYPEAPLMK